jgi:hypothetical protein
MEKAKSIKLVLVLVCVAIIVVVVMGYKTNNEKQEFSENLTSEKATVPLDELSDEDIKAELDSTLDVLMRIHYVSIIEKKSNNPESVIVDELTESMDDLNKLKGLVYKTEALSKSRNEIIATTGLVLNLSTQSLIKTYDTWIQYLRGVDINNINISEFQYQLALFQSSTHDIYLTLVENSSLLPMVTVKFAKEGEGENSVNEDLKNHFLAKIDELFKDILIDNEKFYKETKNRYAIAILISGYQNFFK